MAAKSKKHSNKKQSRWLWIALIGGGGMLGLLGCGCAGVIGWHQFVRKDGKGLVMQDGRADQALAKKDEPADTTLVKMPGRFIRPTRMHFNDHDKTLTVDEWLGPPGAEAGRIRKGKYIVKGTYDLSNATGNYKVGKTHIALVVTGFYEIQKPDDAKIFPIPQDRQKGTYEVSITLKEVMKSTGSLMVEWVWSNRPVDTFELTR